MPDQRETSEGAARSPRAGPRLAEGETFARRYEIRKLVGIGGFARVYRAVDTEHGGEVAIKLHSPDSDSGREQLSTAEKRFYREARLLSRLESPHTIGLHDYGRTADGQLYMVCEFVEGTELKAVLHAEAPLEEGRARNLATQILRSLADAHATSILHRDIKPSNVMVCEGEGAGEEVRVLDFGIAKSVAAESERQGDLTKDGVVVGTPRYMSPEQTRGRPLRPQSDLFSVGLLVFEMLVGHSPYDGRSLRAVRQRMRKGPIRLPRDVDVADDLERVTNAMLEREIEERLGSARTALERLGAVAEEPDPSLGVSEDRADSGVSYPLGLGGYSDSGVRSVDTSDETRSEPVYAQGPVTPESREASMPAAADPEEGNEFHVSPTVVDPDVRPPDDSDERGATFDTARMPDGGEPSVETDRASEEAPGSAGVDGTEESRRREGPLLFPVRIVVTSLVAAGVAGAVSYWLASRTSDPESAPPRATSAGSETPEAPAREERQRERPSPELAETMRRARRTVLRGVSAAEGRIQSVPQERRRDERESDEGPTAERSEPVEEETSPDGPGAGGDGSEEAPAKPERGSAASRTGSSDESTPAEGEGRADDEPRIQPKPIDSYDD